MSRDDRRKVSEVRKSIAAAAASNVDGYLRNASRNTRTPAAEGGRGTRRKMAMVSSAQLPEVVPGAITAAELVQLTGAADTATVEIEDNEWDEVDLPVPLLAKLEISVKKDEASGVIADEGVAVAADAKGETNDPAMAKPDVVDGTEPASVTAVKPAVKAEFGAIGAPQQVVQVVDDEIVIDGSRSPLHERPAQPTWRLSDPAYEAMLEQRDLLAAQRRSERMHTVSVSITHLLALLLRGRLLWRECHHPQLLRRLLRLHTTTSTTAVAETVGRGAEELGDTGPRKKRRLGEQPIHSSERGPPTTARTFFFMDAVKTAQRYATAAGSPGAHKPSLAPTWVTAARDGANNETSKGISALLRAIRSHFVLVPDKQHQTEGEEGDADRPSTSDEAETPVAGVNVRHASSADTPDEHATSNWSATLTPGFLGALLRRSLVAGEEGGVAQRVPLPHPVYFAAMFLALAGLSGFDCRLVLAQQQQQSKRPAGQPSADRDAVTAEGDDEGAGGGSRRKEKLSIFGPSRRVREGKKRGRGSTSADAGEGVEVRSRKLPTSCVWAEVWSKEKGCFIAVNPCAECTTLWGSPFTFSIGPDVIVDATPRYCSKFSTTFAYNRRIGHVRQFGFLWQEKVKWDQDVEISEVLLRSFKATKLTAARSEQLARERRQLDSLMYSEPVPTTLNALHRHPLFTIESDLARHEGIFPKDATTLIGSVKGHDVFKRSAVVNLRSLDGWLREGRSLVQPQDGSEPAAYKVVPPPASRPFARPSLFYGYWQTKPFEPLPLREDGSIPHHGRTTWYILMSSAPPPGLVHVDQPQIGRVARRMRLDLGLAVTGFIQKRTTEHRRASWEAVIEGIVVKQSDYARLLRAYAEWVQVTQEQEAAKRRDRALRWWVLLSQRLLALQRLQSQYMQGRQMHGGLPTL